MVSDEFGLLPSGPNCSYKIMREYYNAALNKDQKTVSRIHSEFSVLYEILFKNVPAGKIDATYDKLFLKFSIPDFPTRLLPPYIGATEQQAQNFVKEAREKLPHWWD